LTGAGHLWRSGLELTEGNRLWMSWLKLLDSGWLLRSWLELPEFVSSPQLQPRTPQKIPAEVDRSWLPKEVWAGQLTSTSARTSIDNLFPSTPAYIFTTAHFLSIPSMISSANFLPSTPAKTSTVRPTQLSTFCQLMPRTPSHPPSFNSFSQLQLRPPMPTTFVNSCLEVRTAVVGCCDLG
jgi:hypothetical protein